MIIEPTGWAIQCNGCGRRGRLGLPIITTSDALARARAGGWIAPVARITYCSVDCLTRDRRRVVVRMVLAAVTRAHMTGHATACCALHRTHATRGRHSWDGQCVDPNKAGVAVL